jgi:hypothetical protein
MRSVLDEGDRLLSQRQRGVRRVTQIGDLELQLTDSREALLGLAHGGRGRLGAAGCRVGHDEARELPG